jgi:transcriptional regulator with XRE-family HTH domain
LLFKTAMPVKQRHRHILGETVRKFRNKVGLTQEKLAEKSGLSTVFISRIEREMESPSLDSLVKIAKALGVRVRDLVADI